MSDELVQRLRDYPSYEECLQAADRIEALELQVGDLKQSYNSLAAEGLGIAKRNVRLEAALQEIAYPAYDPSTWQTLRQVHDIARRALEGKP